MSDEIAIRVDNVSKDFVLPHEKVSSFKSLFTSVAKPRGKGGKETQHALKDISLEVKKGEFFGIVGRNGSGKSTLLRILAGIYQPNKGQVVTIGKLVPFIELGVGFNPELTGRENVYLNGALVGFSKSEVDAMYNDIVSFAELERFMDQKLKNYSSGMQVRLAFSLAVRAEADILLVDEVLAVGDADFQRKCFDYFRTLKKNKKTVVFVSHDMTAVREYCDRAVLIEKNQIIKQGKANEVATAYTKMFIEENNQAEDSKTGSKKWGDSTANYQQVSLSTRKLTDDDNDLVVNAEAIVNRQVDNLIFGFSINDASGENLLGTNSQIRKKTVTGLRAGDKVNVTWTIPNIFNEGQHYVDVTIVYKDGLSVAEWWERAVSFKVLPEEITPYPVAPTIGLEIQVNKEAS